MKTKSLTTTVKVLTLSLALVAFTTSSFAKKREMPNISHEGLERVKTDGSADYVYLLPNADFSQYNKIMLAEPQVSFQRFWQDDINSNRTFDRISNSDVAKMVKKGKKLLLEEFTKEIKEGDLTIADQAEGDVLLVKAIISDLTVNAPDPNETAGAWTRVYADSAGDATLTIELYDSVTEQILVRAIDTKIDIGDSYSWRRARNHYTNVNDAREALNSWAQNLVVGLQRAMAAGSDEESQ